MSSVPPRTLEWIRRLTVALVKARRMRLATRDSEPALRLGASRWRPVHHGRDDTEAPRLLASWKVEVHVARGGTKLKRD